MQNTEKRIQKHREALLRAIYKLTDADRRNKLLEIIK